MALQVRRGTNAERLGITPAEGELIFTTDTKQLYVGDGTTAGGITSIAGTIDSLLADSTPQLGGTLDLNNHDITGTGNINITGTITATGNINLGDDVGDIISLTGAIAGHLVPQNDSDSNIGSPTKYWNSAWINQLTVDSQITAERIQADIIADDSTVVFNAATGTVAAAQVSGTFTGNVIGNVTGNVTGYQIGDMTGSVFADDSTLLVDGASSTLQGVFQGTLDTTGTQIHEIYTDSIRSNILNFKKYGGVKSAPTEPGNFDRQGINFSSFNTSAGDYVDEAIIFSYHQTAGGGYLGISPVASDNSTFFDTAIEIDGNAQKLIVSAEKGSTFNGPVSPAVYADDTARDTAIPTPTAGMIVFNTTGTKFQGYTGSAWVDLN